MTFFHNEVIPKLDAQKQPDAYIYAKMAMARYSLRSGQTQLIKRTIDEAQTIIDENDQIQLPVLAAFYCLSADSYKVCPGTSPARVSLLTCSL